VVGCVKMSRIHRLRTQLQTHQVTDDQERGYLDAMLSLLDLGETSCSRDHFEPGHFTASAFVLSPDGGDLLLILHAKLRLWLQPGGHVEPSDPSFEAAARREVAEEVGIQQLTPLGAGLLDVDVHDIPAFGVPGKGGAPPHQHFDLRYSFVAGSRDVVASSDAEDARWVPLGEVSQVKSDASVMRAVRRLVAR
jgi:8-oxo-dGTP pyrophosphatase MutT (NUDIX family)